MIWDVIGSEKETTRRWKGKYIFVGKRQRGVGYTDNEAVNNSAQPRYRLYLYSAGWRRAGASAPAPRYVNVLSAVERNQENDLCSLSCWEPQRSLIGSFNFQALMGSQSRRCTQSTTPIHANIHTCCRVNVGEKMNLTLRLTLLMMMSWVKSSSLENVVVNEVSFTLYSRWHLVSKLWTRWLDTERSFNPGALVANVA